MLKIKDPTHYTYTLTVLANTRNGGARLSTLSAATSSCIMSTLLDFWFCRANLNKRKAKLGFTTH